MTATAAARVEDHRRAPRASETGTIALTPGMAALLFELIEKSATGAAQARDLAQLYDAARRVRAELCPA